MRSGRRKKSREESVYNLCEKPKEYIIKPPLYKSLHNPKRLPTNTTFGLQNTTKLPGTNIHGGMTTIDDHGKYRSKREYALMGRGVKQTHSPTTFTKKFSGTKKLPRPSRFKRSLVKEKRAGVPRKHDQPIVGLRTEKNFVRSNIVEAIRSKPKGMEMELNYLHKEDFGQVPQYLDGVKAEIEEEYRYAKELRKRSKKSGGDQLEVLPEDERLQILKSLEEKRAELLVKYQKISFTMPSSKGKGKGQITLDNTNYIVRKKENFERELDEIEKHIEKFSKKRVFIYN